MRPRSSKRLGILVNYMILFNAVVYKSSTSFLCLGCDVEPMDVLMLIYVGPLWISLEMKIKTNKYCSGAILGQENPLGDFGHFNLGIMGYDNWNNNWGNSWNNWGNGKGKGRGKNWFQNQGFNNYNRAAPYYGGAQSVTSQLGNALGEMASMTMAIFAQKYGCCS